MSAGNQSSFPGELGGGPVGHYIASHDYVSSGGFISPHIKSKGFTMVRAYKLFSAGTATADAAATITIPRSGTVLGVMWSISGVAGAAVTGTLQVELANTSIKQIQTNDTPGSSLSEVAVAWPIASAAEEYVGYHPIGIAINQGDKLFLHMLAQGQALTNCNTNAVIFINH